MSQLLATRREQEIVESAIREEGVNLSDLVLLCDDTDVGPEILDGDWQADDTGAIHCEFVLGVIAPDRFEDAETKMSAFISGVEVSLMEGVLTHFEVGEGRTTTDPFRSASAASLWNRTTLDEVVEYPGLSPELIIRDGLSRIPYKRVRVDPSGEPALYFTRDRGNLFTPDRKVGDILSQVEEETPYTFRDTATGGHVASPAVELGRLETPKRLYHASDILGWRPPPRIEQRYSGVVVFRTNPDGNDAFREYAPITYRASSQPRRHTTFYVELDDESPEGPQGARQLSYDLARKFTRGVYSDDELILPYFDPLIERQDSFAVDEEHEDLDSEKFGGFWDRRWLCWISRYKHARARLDQRGSSQPGIRTTVDYTATLLEQDLVKPPAFIGPGLTGGVIRTTRPPCGRMGDDLYFSDTLSWVLRDGDDLILADGAGTVRRDGDDLVIECDERVEKPLWGEDPVGVLFFDESVSWVSSDGDVTTIDEAASQGNAWLNGDVGVVS